MGFGCVTTLGYLLLTFLITDNEGNCVSLLSYHNDYIADAVLILAKVLKLRCQCHSLLWKGMSCLSMANAMQLLMPNIKEPCKYYGICHSGKQRRLMP